MGEIEVGTVHEGTVTGITNFGAFVMIAPGKSGLVHISEVSNSYVNDIREHLSEGQSVTVKVVSLDNSGRLNLSIKATVPAAEFNNQRGGNRSGGEHRRDSRRTGTESRNGEAPRGNFRSAEMIPPTEPTFEDKLKRFMQDSDSKMSDNKMFVSQKGAKRRR